MKKLLTFEPENRWNIHTFDLNQVNSLSQSLKIEPILAKFLISKGLDQLSAAELKRFLKPHHSEIGKFDRISVPEQIRKTCQRIATVVKKNESIYINGDPDADGITGTTVLVAGLRYFGIPVEYDFPVRSKEGHGIQPRIIEDAHQRHFPLIISTDCGTKDVEAVRYAQSLGIDVIICDHHIMGHQSPPAYAMINPYMVDGHTPEQELSGSLLAYKLMLAVSHHLHIPFTDAFKSYLLSVACLGALSDRVSLLEPMNRIMIKDGIAALNQTEMQGLRALKYSSAGEDIVLTANETSRSIVPRINAPGRIGDPDESIPDSNIVVDLLLLGTGKKSAKKANRLMKILKENFISRKKLEAELDEIDQVDVRKQVLSIESINDKRKQITSRIEESPVRHHVHHRPIQTE